MAHSVRTDALHCARLDALVVSDLSTRLGNSEPNHTSALDDDATVSGEVEEDASVEDAIVSVDKDDLGLVVVRLITYR